MARYFTHCIDEWCEVSENIYSGWWGPKAFLMDEEEFVHDNSGWTIQKQGKKYGPYVEVTLNGKLEIHITPNPGGLTISKDTKALDKIPATRKNADAIGFQLERLLETMETLSNDKIDAIFELPYDAIIADDLEATVITKPSFPISPFSYK